MYKHHHTHPNRDSTKDDLFDEQFEQFTVSVWGEWATDIWDARHMSRYITGIRGVWYSGFTVPLLCVWYGTSDVWVCVSCVFGLYRYPFKDGLTFEKFFNPIRSRHTPERERDFTRNDAPIT